MIMDGYIAHHQVYTIFQRLPRQAPPDHMCHPWPISRVGSRSQNFAWKSQISLPNKSLRTLWTFFPLRPIMGHERAWDLLKRKNRRKIEILCPRIGCIFFTDFVFLFFGVTPLHKLCTWLLLKKNQRNLVFRPIWFGGTQHHKMCSGLLLIQWFSLGFLLIFFSAELNITKCAPEFCWSGIFFGGNP